MHTSPTVLVTAATGKTGGRVARRLAERGVTVRAASRSGATHLDWTDPSTWDAALHGVDAAYLALYPDVTAPDAGDTVREFAARATAAGVRRLVLLSVRAGSLELPAERALRESGAEWVLLRAAWFGQNLTEGFLAPGIHAGEVVFPADAVLEPFLDADDLADVAVAALTGAVPGNTVHELTGPRLLTFGEAVATAAAAHGRDVSYVPVTAEEYPAYLTGLGLPAEEAEFLSRTFATLLDGRGAHLTDDVHRILGRAPRDLADTLRAAQPLPSV